MSHKFTASQESIQLLGLRRGVLALSLLLAQSIGCASVHCYKEQTGTVLDKETNEPIEGAAVVAVYYVEQSSAGGAVSTYADAQEVQTVEGGEFVLPGKCVSVTRLTPFRFDMEPELYIYKPGYRMYGTNVHATAVVLNGGRTEYRLPVLVERKERMNNIDIPDADIQSHKIEYFLKLADEERVELGYKPRGGE